MSVGRVTLGRVAGAYGIKGWVRLVSYCRPHDNILKYRRWWLAHRDGYEVRVVQARAHGQGFVAQITDAAGSEIEDRNLAEALAGVEIQVERSALPKLATGEFYWTDLIGLQVRSLEGAVLGVVDDITSNGAQDVLVVKEGALERLIPFVHGPIIKSVDVAQGQIVADWQLDY